jgi:drug/metabolite transporter (DMT)-like permease
LVPHRRPEGTVNIHNHPDGKRAATGAGDVQARLMLVLLCLIWGVTWPMMKIALTEIPPLSMRTLTAGIGASGLVVICLITRRSLRVPAGKAWAHVVAASILNVTAFSLFTAFAQIAAATSRVAILTYAMPIWALVLAWVVLGERPSRIQTVAITLCAVGLAVLILPLATGGVPIGLLLALASGFSWAAGTVYLKWARIEADPVGVATWQIAIAFFVIAGFMFAFDGGLDLRRAHAGALWAVLFAGVAGNAIAYALWFDIVRRVSALTATLGVVGIPVIGVVSTMLILGERLTAADGIGFAFIFAASVCAQVPASAWRKAIR